MYILLCSDDSYYVGSTIDLVRRLEQHSNGSGANHTKNRLPVKLVYAEYFSHIALAFKREKQIQKWRREKKECLIKNQHYQLPELALAYRDRGLREPQSPEH